MHTRCLHLLTILLCLKDSRLPFSVCYRKARSVTSIPMSFSCQWTASLYIPGLAFMSACSALALTGLCPWRFSQQIASFTSPLLFNSWHTEGTWAFPPPSHFSEGFTINLCVPPIPLPLQLRMKAGLPMPTPVA